MDLRWRRLYSILVSQWATSSRNENGVTFCKLGTFFMSKLS